MKVNSEHILIIDDDISFLEQAEKILQEKYKVSLALSGEQAVNYLESGGRADIILLDVVMPGMNGFQTLEKIKATEGGSNIPVIFLTGLNDSDSELNCFLSGAADYITKPYDSRVLLARIDRRLRTGYMLDEEKLALLPEELTDTERTVAKLLARNFSNEEIANELHYAIDTVKKTVSRILMKLQIKNRREIKNYLK